MTEMTPSATTEPELAAQTKAAAVKRRHRLPVAQGLYDPRNEHDACGVGFIAQMKGVKSHQIVKDGLSMLENLTHRGAVGADPLMGDGAGVLVQIPDRFFREEMAEAGHRAAAAGPIRRRPSGSCRRMRRCAPISKRSSSRSAQSEGLPLIGFRDVPVDNSSLSKAPDIAASEPFHRQVFIGRTADIDRRRGIRGAGSISCAR